MTMVSMKIMKIFTCDQNYELQNMAEIEKKL